MCHLKDEFEGETVDEAKTGKSWRRLLWEKVAIVSFNWLWLEFPEKKASVEEL